MNEEILKTKLVEDDIVKEICKNYTYEFKEIYEFVKHNIKDFLPSEYNIGVIVGSSGSGKSLLLNEFGTYNKHHWDNNKAIASHFKDYPEAVERLSGVGFNSIPMWLVPYNILSTGQKYRVNLARSIGSGMVADEFTSVIDRSTAKGLCYSLSRYIKTKGLKNIVFATVHKDIIDYLKPDWVYNTDEKSLTINDLIWDVSFDTITAKAEFVKKDHFMEL